MRGKDLTGCRFGRLVVQQKAGTGPHGYALWRCRCDCGNSITCESRDLKNGSRQDCGCSGPRARIDLRGRRFGQATALAPAQTRSADGDVVWNCQCDCGACFQASSRQLLRGSVRDCGCMLDQKKQWVGRRFGMLTVTDYGGKRDHRTFWRCRCDCGRTVDVRESSLKNGHTTSCGCQVNPTGHCHFTEGTFVEAIETRTTPRNNTSGVRGVSWDQRSQRWVARIGFQGKTYYLGSYERLEDARAARLRGEEMYDEFLDWYHSTADAYPVARSG